MLTITESLGYRKATVGALHRRAPGVHRDRCAASFFRFAGQYAQELSPGCIADALGQTVIMNHASDVQVFKGDQVVSLDEFSRCLVVEIQPLSSDLQVRFGHQDTGLTPPYRPLDSSGKTLLSFNQQVFTSSKTTWVVDRRAIREDCEGLQPDINADRVTWLTLPWGIAQVTREDSVPFVAIPLQGDGLDLAFNWPVQLDLQSAHILNIEPIRKPDAIAISGEGDRIEAVSTSETGVSWLLTRLATPEECLECPIQASQDVLSSRAVQSGAPRVLGANLLQLVGLVVVVDRNAVLPGIASLLEGSVVEGAGDIQQATQSLVLLFVGIEPIHEGFAHLLTLLGLDVLPDCGLTDIAHSAAVVAPRPKTRQFGSQDHKLRAQKTRGLPFELVHNMLDCLGRLSSNEHMNVVRHNLYRLKLNTELLSFKAQNFLEPYCDIISQHFFPVLRTPDEVILDVVDTARISLVPVTHAYDYTTANLICQTLFGKEVCADSSVT